MKVPNCVNGKLRCKLHMYTVTIQGVANIVVSSFIHQKLRVVSFCQQ